MSEERKYVCSAVRETGRRVVVRGEPVDDYVLDYVYVRTAGGRLERFYYYLGNVDVVQVFKGEEGRKLYVLCRYELGDEYHVFELFELELEQPIG